MSIEFIGMACALGLSAMGSAFGAGFAAQASVGAWKKCYANGKPAPFIMVAFSGAPLTQTIYGFLLMNFIRSAVASGADPALAMFTGIFAGLAIGLSAFFQGKVAAASADALGETGKGTAKAAEEMKALASTLGEHFAADSRNLNGGYPVLAWQNPAQPQLASGDVNGDGKIDNTDAALVYAYFNGKAELTEEQLARADVDGDGEISNIDAGLIYAFYSGKISAFPKAQ